MTASWVGVVTYQLICQWPIHCAIEAGRKNNGTTHYGTDKHQMNDVVQCVLASLTLRQVPKTVRS